MLPDLSQSQKPNEEDVRLSPNLSEPEFIGSPKEIETLTRVLRIEHIILLVAELAVFLLVVLNYKLQQDINSLDSQIVAAKDKFKAISEAKTEIDSIRSKYAAYLEVKSSNPKVQDIIGVTYTATPAEITIDRLVYEQLGSLQLSMAAPQASSFARLISSYLATEPVGQIVLTGAKLDAQKGSYTFDIQVYLKKGTE